MVLFRRLARATRVMGSRRLRERALVSRDSYALGARASTRGLWFERPASLKAAANWALVTFT